MESAELPWMRAVSDTKEGIVDMVGPGKHYSPFSETVNIVYLSLSPGKSDIEYDASMRWQDTCFTLFGIYSKRHDSDNMEVFHTGSIDQNLLMLSTFTKCNLRELMPILTFTVRMFTARFRLCCTPMNLLTGPLLAPTTFTHALKHRLFCTATIP